jgi:hypothetical protein
MPQPRAATGAAAGPVDEALPAAAVTASATARTRRPARKA